MATEEIVVIHSPKRRASGFTLLELIVVVALISAIATALVLTVFGQMDHSRVAAVANTARMINEAASVYRMENGAWPKDVDNSIMPKELSAVLPANLFRRDVAIGGRWDWNGPGGSLDVIGVSIRYNTKSEANLTLLRELDALLDDGALDTGKAKIIDTKTRFFFQISVDGK